MAKRNALTSPALCVLVALCIVTQMTTATWCSVEVKVIVHIWADEHISKKPDFADRNNDIRENWEQKQQHVKVRGHISHTDSRSFGVCCQTANIEAVCPDFCSDCANKPLQD